MTLAPCHGRSEQTFGFCCLLDMLFLLKSLSVFFWGMWALLNFSDVTWIFIIPTHFSVGSLPFVLGLWRAL